MVPQLDQAGDGDPIAAEAPARRTTSRSKRLLRLAALAVVIGFVAVLVAQEWDGFVAGLARLAPAAIAGALAAIAVGLSCAMMSWRAVLVGLGSRLPVAAAARVYFLGQLGKYVPGSVWTVLAQAELSGEYGVSRPRAGLASLVQMLIGLVVGACLAAVTLATSSPDAFTQYWWVLLVAAAGVVALVPAVLQRLVAIALRLLRRPADGSVQGRAIVISALWCVGMWLAFGAHLWLLAGSLGASGSRLFLVMTGAYALAWVVGFVIIFLPAGAGAREGVLVLALAPVLARQDALVLALVSRALMLLGDGVSAGVAVLAEQRRARRSRTPRHRRT